MAQMIKVFSKHTEPVPGSQSKVKQVTRTHEVDRAKLKQKLGPEGWKRFMDGYPVKFGNYTVTVG